MIIFCFYSHCKNLQKKLVHCFYFFDFFLFYLSSDDMFSFPEAHRSLFPSIHIAITISIFIWVVSFSDNFLCSSVFFCLIISLGTNSRTEIVFSFSNTFSRLNMCFFISKFFILSADFAENLSTCNSWKTCGFLVSFNTFVSLVFFTRMI